MRYLKVLGVVLLSVVMLAVTGCGSSSTTTSDPFAKTGGGGNPTGGTASQGDHTYGITLATDKTIYESDVASVIATAKVVRDGVPVTGVPVAYTVLSGPVTLGYFTPTTDTNGVSIANLAVNSAKATTNVIIQASITSNGVTNTAYSQFVVNGHDPTAEPAPTVFMTLTSDIQSVDVDNGTVILNSNLIYGTDYLYKHADGTSYFIAHGSTIPDLPVKFSVITGPATITGSTLQTDKNGNSKAILTTGHSLITTNVIVEASTEFDGKTYRAYTTIQIVRGGGVIMFTDLAGLYPGKQSNILEPYEGVVLNPSVTPSVSVVQLIPFKITDSNGNPRVGVPVTLSVYSIIGDPNSVTIDYLVPPRTEPDQQTITSDSAGMGIFNVSVGMKSPAPGSFTAATVVFKAVTNDLTPVTAYVGRSYSLTAPPPKEQ